MSVQDFYRSLLVRDAFSDVTIEGYKRVLTKFLKEAKTHKPTKQQVEDYIAELRKRKYSYSHLRNTTVILERYMRFTKRPVKLGRMKRPQPIVKDILTEGEVARMLGACKNLREKTIISILAYSGIRNKEFCSLRVKDIDLDKGLIRVFSGKGSKDRLAYISRECASIINGYLEAFPREKEQFLVTALVSGSTYSGWALRKRVKVIAKRAGIERQVYPHLMRHSLASHLVSKNCSLLTLQNLLGHSQLNTTQLYLRSFPQKIQAEYLYLVPNYM